MNKYPPLDAQRWLEDRELPTGHLWAPEPPPPYELTWWEQGILGVLTILFVAVFYVLPVYGLCRLIGWLLTP